jgi:hypothetical protein
VGITDKMAEKLSNLTNMTKKYSLDEIQAMLDKGNATIIFWEGPVKIQAAKLTLRGVAQQPANSPSQRALLEIWAELMDLMNRDKANMIFMQGGRMGIVYLSKIEKLIEGAKAKEAW